MSEMVERGARRLAANPPAFSDYSDVPVEEVFSRPRYSHLATMCRRQARLVIAAMRDPTPAMRDAVRPWLADDRGNPVDDDECDSLIEAVIDAALVL